MADFIRDMQKYSKIRELVLHMINSIFNAKRKLLHSISNDHLFCTNAQQN